MSKLTKWEKIELLSLYRRERIDKRCVIVQNLTNKAKELTKDLNIEITALKAKLSKLEKLKTKTLETHKLIIFEGSNAHACTITTLHNSLIVFDAETNTEIQRILRDE